MTVGVEFSVELEFLLLITEFIHLYSNKCWEIANSIALITANQKQFITTHSVSPAHRISSAQ